MFSRWKLVTLLLAVARADRALVPPRFLVKRWYSEITSWRFWRDGWSTKLLLILYVCVRLGWAKSADDVLHPTGDQRGTAACASPEGEPRGQPRGSVPSQVGVGSASASSSSGAAASSSAAAGAPAPEVAIAPAASGTSRAQAKAEGQAFVESARARSENTLHVVARLMSDADLVQQIDWVAHATMPFSRDHSACAHGLRSADANMKQYSDWAAWGFMGTLREVVVVTGNMSAMAACGFRTEFPKASPAAGLDPSALAFENTSFEAFWALVFSVLRAQVGHHIRYVSGVPFFLAGLLHEDASVVHETFAAFKRLVDGWRAAETRTTAQVEGLRQRSPLSRTSMRWATLYAEAGSWATVTGQMRSHLCALFRTLGQSEVPCGPLAWGARLQSPGHCPVACVGL